MAKYFIEDTTLTGIAGAIRGKEGSSGAIPVADFASRIGAIDTQEDLDAEMATQDNLITQITAALEGKMVPQKAYDASELNFYLGSDGYVYFSSPVPWSEIKSFMFYIMPVNGYSYPTFVQKLANGTYQYRDSNSTVLLQWSNGSAPADTATEIRLYTSRTFTSLGSTFQGTMAVK